jgi:hypothetical protein
VERVLMGRVTVLDRFSQYENDAITRAELEEARCRLDAPVVSVPLPRSAC